MIYTKAFIEIYHSHSRKLLQKTYKIVKIEKYSISRVENSLNLDSQQFYKIFKILQSTYIMLKDTKNNIFYLNNYID